MSETEGARLWIVTGAGGFLGSTLVRNLLERGEKVRALVYEDSNPALRGLDCEVVAADVTDPASIERALVVPEGVESIVVHSAGVVSIASRVPDVVRAVNVDGTKNVVEACRNTGASRLVYVSSVHAIPEPNLPVLITEVDEASRFEEGRIVGGYARSKAQATAHVLRAEDVDRVIVHPAGMIGPGDEGPGHMTTMIRNAAERKLPMTVEGGYNFADVRDVAEGIVAAAEKGVRGRTYLLTNRYITVQELAEQAALVAGVPPPKGKIPLWLGKAFAPLAELYANLTGTQPLFTPYSMYTLSAPSDFTCRRAAKELGWSPRPLEETVADTVQWMGTP